MLDKLPIEVMERILPLITPMEYLKVSFLSTKMREIVEETPKKYGAVQYAAKGQSIYLAFVSGPLSIEDCVIPLPANYSTWGIPKMFGDPPVLMGGRMDKRTRLYLTGFFRLLFRNSTIEEFREPPPLSFGNEFWFSLNMKVTEISAPKDVASITQLQQFLEHFRPTRLIYDYLFHDSMDRVAQCEQLLQGELFRNLEQLHICAFMGDVRCLQGVRAKDLLIGIVSVNPHQQYRMLLHFLLRRISDWLHGEGEIDKLQICVGEDDDAKAEKIFKSLVEKVAMTLTPEIGWIDRTYEGMELILRASDGQALLVFWDDVDGYFYLIRCEYNFRRGRCLGSFQRNEDSLRRIRQLMSLSMELHERNPELAENAREKLKNECIKFNEYNKGATQIDLMTDSIWRPKGERRSPWGIVDGNVRHDSVYLMDSPVLHAFRFAKAFEERGVLPEIDQFKPVTHKPPLELYNF